MTRNEKLSSVYVFMLLALFLIFAGILTQQQDDKVKPQSVLSVSPTIPQEASSTLEEPIVTSWRTYASTQYNFSVDVPSDWKEQEYPSAQPTGGFLVAFSPKDLPCGTCTYFRNGYYSVKVFNATSDPEYYKDFKFRMNNLGKIKDYQGVQLGQSKGIMGVNTFAIEHSGVVYEISLDAKEGNAKIAESKILQKVITSVKFNDLQF